MISPERAVDLFRRTFGTDPEFVAEAPGRVNLIGEHTDYNDGFVLPLALPFTTAIAVRPRTDRTIDLHSEGFGHTIVDLDADPSTSPSWATYVHGFASLVDERGDRATGWDGAIASDVPIGASLSSSAALEIAAGHVFARIAGREADPVELALLGQRVENEIIGLPSGIMDQLVSAAASEGSALLIDCRSLTTRPVTLPDDVVVVVIDTGTRRELVESEYADRRATCERVVAELGIDALRDATVADLDRLDPADSLGRRRALHVIRENERTLAAAEAAETGDIQRLGRLLDESHQSLSELYEVSSPALDAAAAFARTLPGCIGARMTGGGFAGCAIALVEAGAADAFSAAVEADFTPPASQPATEPVSTWPVRPGAGGRISPVPTG